MVTYEYLCKACETRFELEQRIGEKLDACQSCKSGQIVRLISKSTFVLKGSGWAKDGYS